MIEKEKWIIDTDPGCDDIMALLYLLTRPNVEVLMIGLTDGNVSLEHVCRNGQKLLKLINKKIPLHRGAQSPIIKVFPNEESYHYRDGLGDIEQIQCYDASDIQIEPEPSSVKLVELVNTFPNQINLLCLGPLTNISMAYMIDPTITTKIKRTYMMGGAIYSSGNLNAVAEFNFAYDFIAAKIVLNNFRNIILTPWEPTEVVYFRSHTIMELASNVIETEENQIHLAFKFISLIIDKYTAEKNGIQFCDFYSVIPAFKPQSAVQMRKYNLDISIDSDDMYGMIVVNKRSKIKSDLVETLEELERDRDYTSHVVIEKFEEKTLIEEHRSIFLK